MRWVRESGCFWQGDEGISGILSGDGSFRGFAVDASLIFARMKKTHLPRERGKRGREPFPSLLSNTQAMVCGLVSCYTGRAGIWLGVMNKGGIAVV